jgi:signal transduction histidine kinase
MSSVMVVEDECIIARDISDSLTAMGYDVTGTASSAADCVRRAATLRPDLVLMDIHLAGELDGIEAARELRECFDIPVVYLTAYADDETIDRAKATRPLGYLTKPFRKTELRSTIEVGLFRHQRERQLQRQEETRELPVAGQFSSLATVAASVAHEINNPLTYILSNAHVARQELSRMEAALADSERSVDATSVRESCSQTKELLLEVEDGVRHIGRIAADLGALGRRESAMESQDIVAALEWALRVSHATLKHLARVTRRFSPVPQVWGDGVQLRQVFLNLALNAAQAMRGRPFDESELFVSTEFGSDGQVCVSMRDTGSGMTPETMARIFDPYFTTKQRDEVAGLGLSVCRRAVGAMGGSISVRSELGRGSTFVVKLRPAPARPEPPQPTASGGDRRIVSHGETTGQPSAH